MTATSTQQPLSKTITGDLFGGTAAMLVALPSAIAFGLIIFAPLGTEFSGKAALGGIIGTVALGLMAALFGGTKKLISAPSAPAAAVLSVFVAELVKSGSVSMEIVPFYVTLVALFAGAVQVILGLLGGGKLIKYIPYPVVAGYLSGIGVLIFTGQLPKLMGIPKEKFFSALSMPQNWQWESITIGLVTITVMFLAPRIIKTIPAAIIALTAGVLTYFGIAFVNPALLSLQDNHFVIGAINASASDLVANVTERWSYASAMNSATLFTLFAPVMTLAVLLSIDTLKTCVVMDALTFTRHDSNKELIGQGMGNMTSALLGGVPGAGTMGPTLVNLNSGAKTKTSSLIFALMALLVLLLLGKLVAWIPISALAGILIVVAIRMVDVKSFSLLKHKTTMLDFFVILGVVISAISLSLIMAAGVGITLAIILFLREQMRSSVIRRKTFGNQVFSKKVRLSTELAVLEEKGSQTIILELQGQLFFGTTDQLFSKLEPYLANCKYALLDMRRVQSIDYTAVNMLKQILARVKEKKGFLVFTSIPLSLPSGQNVKEYLERLGLSETENLKFYDDIDAALEWAEDEILKSENVFQEDDNRTLNMNEIELFKGFSPASIETLSSCLTEKSYANNEYIFKMKDTSDEVYFVRQGKVKIALPLADGKFYHLVTIGSGGVFGEMAFIDKRKRSADALSQHNTKLYVLSREKFNQVTKMHPEIAGIFFERLALLIANRLRQSDKELKVLQEN